MQKFKLHWTDASGRDHDEYYDTKDEAMQKYYTFNAGNCRQGYIEEVENTSERVPEYTNRRISGTLYSPEGILNQIEEVPKINMFGNPIVSRNILDF